MNLAAAVSVSVVVILKSVVVAVVLAKIAIKVVPKLQGKTNYIQ